MRPWFRVETDVRASTTTRLDLPLYPPALREGEQPSVTRLQFFDPHATNPNEITILRRHPFQINPDVENEAQRRQVFADVDHQFISQGSQEMSSGHDLAILTPVNDNVQLQPRPPQPGAGLEDQLVQPASPIMQRQSHGHRGAEGRYGWFESRSQSLRPCPPQRELFRELEKGDLFINSLEGTPNYQVWIFNEEHPRTWLPASWGELINEHYLVITPGGSPSLVIKATWEKTYKRKPPRIVSQV